MSGAGTDPALLVGEHPGELDEVEFRYYTQIMQPQVNSAIHLKLRNVIDKLLFLDKRNVFAFRDIKLFASEIHLMLLVNQGGERSRNATRIAEHLGVTKGAISQTISRLEKKGILTKVKDTTANNELCLAFTRTGGQAVRRFVQLERDLQERHTKLLRGFSQQDKEVILSFLSRLEQDLEQSGSDG